MITEDLYRRCSLCPRACKTDRTGGVRGICGEDAELRLSAASVHFGEEPPITGTGGSGTVFVTGCNLRCAFCQNYQISQEGMGRAVEGAEFADICLLLQDKGAENINIVTGSHAVPAIADALVLAKKRGLHIPVCWNSSAYELPETLELLGGLADIWLPDLKTLNPALSETVFRARDYPAAAKRAVRWMTARSKPVMQDGKMKSGVIMRHLVLPGRLADTEAVLGWFAENIQYREDGSEGAFLSLMTQYTPVPFAPSEQSTVSVQERAEALEAFQNRYMEQGEFDRLQLMLAQYGIENGFYQELTHDCEWLPDFRNTQPFPSSLSVPVWHWSCGFI